MGKEQAAYKLNREYPELPRGSSFALICERTGHVDHFPDPVEKKHHEMPEDTLFRIRFSPDSCDSSVQNRLIRYIHQIKQSSRTKAQG